MHLYLSYLKKKSETSQQRATHYRRRTSHLGYGVAATVPVGTLELINFGAVGRAQSARRGVTLLAHENRTECANPTRCITALATEGNAQGLILARAALWNPGLRRIVGSCTSPNFSRPSRYY